MFRIVTVAREYGSGGGRIAQLLAERLDWKLLDRCLVEKIAHIARVEPKLAEQYDERPDPWVNRIVRAIWQGGLTRGTMAGPLPELFDADRMASLSQRVIEEAADIGNCVIVGRASQCILQERDDAFHVFIYAPRAERLRRVRSRHASRAEAELSLDARDQERAALIRRYFNQDWANRHLYDLMISSKLGEGIVLSTVMSAMGIGTTK
ncbi:MAG TPA: cytidylate kinase-like family protein [Terriglobia bacterium]|nr:cytidylate kinase-like family protein [Terriglobia bacterium]